jgi:hypothetical protein
MISCATAFHRSFALADRSCAMRLISSAPSPLSDRYSSRRLDDALDRDRPKQPKLCGMKSSSLHAIAAAAAGIVGAAWCTRLAMGANAGSDRIREEEAATAVWLWVWMYAKQQAKRSGQRSVETRGDQCGLVIDQ